MPTNPLKSLADYSRFVTELLGQPSVKYTTVAVWSESPYTGIAEGEVLFTNGLRLRMREEVDFDAGLIVSLGMKSTGAMSACIGTMIFPIPPIQLWLRHYPITSTYRQTSSIIVSPRQT